MNKNENKTRLSYHIIISYQCPVRVHARALNHHISRSHHLHNFLVQHSSLLVSSVESWSLLDARLAHPSIVLPPCDTV